MRQLAPGVRARSFDAEAESERAFYYDAAAEWTQYVSVMAGNEVYVVPTGGRGLGRGLFIRRSRSDITQLASSISRLQDSGTQIAGSVFVDVGANIGTTTVTALRRHSFGSALSIEPAEQVARALRMNLAANDVEHRARVIEAAVGRREEVLALRAKRSIGASKIDRTSRPGSIPVSVVTLNGLVERGVIDVERVGLVWVDTTGHESEMLLGASSLISAGVPLVVRFRRRNAYGATRREAVEALAGAYQTATDLRTQVSMSVAEFDRTERERPRSHRYLFQAPRRRRIARSRSAADSV
jgi:FkbM family methyltransferase